MDCIIGANTICISLKKGPIFVKSKYSFIIIYLLLAFLVVLGVLSSACKFHKSRLDLPDCGALMLPRSWTKEANNGLIIFYDNYGNPSMVQYMYMADLNLYSSDHRSTIRTIMDGSAVTGTLEITQSTIYSNSASYGTAQITINGVSKNVHIIELYGYDRNHIANNMYFYCSDTLSVRSLQQIAKSFRHN